jgi:hypothetical protein
MTGCERSAIPNLPGAGQKETIMDTGAMTFEEILFNGRWHIVGGVILLVFFGTFLRELVREIMMALRERRSRSRSLAFGPVYQGPRLGHTMTDGGEPLEQDEETEHKQED